jgi:hypothetical protein
MADIFISYSKRDRSLPEQLARELQSKGFTVWWDTEPVPGEAFSRSISEQLENARAAIVIWSAASVRSDWVIAEAREAYARGVLIPVRTEDVSVEEIPAPFDELETDLVTNRRSIDRALSRVGLEPRRSMLPETSAPPVNPGSRDPAVEPVEDTSKIAGKARMICSVGLVVSFAGLIVGWLWTGPISGLVLPIGLALLWRAQQLFSRISSRNPDSHFPSAVNG